MKRIFTTIVATVFLVCNVFADEGMWLPLLIGQRQADMQQNGMRISADDIYSVNHASLKDAVVLFGSGCTGEFVSSEGLLLTNHHCGYSYIVSHSTVEADYLTNGFWASDKQSELPCKGLTVTLLVYMKDVTAEVLKGVENTMSEQEREQVIERNIEQVKKEAVKNTHYTAVIKPFYYGNQYFMYVNEVFRDVRLVGAPPSNIGKFGGDTDNWMWPRHTGDFSMFRVYAGKDNKPADYSPDNVPYTPKKHLTINLKGVNEGDFTFVFGYPGTTKQFLTSDAVSFVQNMEDPLRIKMRTIRLNVYNRAMNNSAAQRLRYASRVASIANGWKKWQGEVKGLQRLGAIEQKQERENQFATWAAQTPERQKQYGGLLPEFQRVYSQTNDARLALIYINEGLFASDLSQYAFRGLEIARLTKDNSKSDEELSKSAEKLYNSLCKLFANDYENHKQVDKEIFAKTMSVFYEDFGKQHYPQIADMIAKSKFKDDTEAFFADIYEKSIFSNSKQIKKIFERYNRKNAKKIMADPVVAIIDGIMNDYSENYATLVDEAAAKTDSLYRLYVAGIMEMNTQRDFFPDANLTLRVTYGKVKSFEPMDGVVYKPYTTIEGIMEKENPQIYDYVVEKKLKQLYNEKDYGIYANKDGELPVAFIASNHTTGGNSGSPVLDADGNLVGINFDRNWEGTMSDIMYDPSRCRNISLDIRYCLFIIDKFAGAKHLVEEMTILK